MSKIETVKYCPVCHSKNSRKILQVRDNAFNNEIIFPLSRCQKCDLKYLSKRPTKTSIGDYYPDIYEPYNIHKKDFYIELQNSLMRSYFKKDKSIKDHFLSNIFKVIYGSFPRPDVNNPRILDIGCGNGLFISSLKRNGWEVYGVDISKKATDFAKKVLKLKNIKQGDIEKIIYPNSFFDVVIMTHVIEHVFNPNNLLNNAAKILKNNGTIIMTTPNADSINFKIFKTNWFPLETPRHLTLFNHSSMKMLAKNAGLNIKKTFHDKSSHALLKSLAYSFGINLSRLKLFLIPLTVIFSFLGKSDIATYHLVKYTQTKKTRI